MNELIVFFFNLRIKLWLIIAYLTQIYLDTKNKQKMIFVNCYIALKRHSELWHKKLEIIQICLIIGEIDL